MKLYKSQHGKMLAGVCAGIAEYWNFDVTLLRIIIVAIAIITKFWTIVLLYIIAAILMPSSPYSNIIPKEDVPKKSNTKEPRDAKIVD